MLKYMKWRLGNWVLQRRTIIPSSGTALVSGSVSRMSKSLADGIQVYSSTPRCFDVICAYSSHRFHHFILTNPPHPSSLPFPMAFYFFPPPENRNLQNKIHRPIPLIIKKEQIPTNR